MPFESVHIPVGATVKVGDDIGSLVSMGVLKGDASIEIAYDKQKVQGSKAEVLRDLVKNPRATASFILYQLYLPNLQELLDGIATVTPNAGAPVVDHQQFVDSGTWSYLGFIPFDRQQAAGTVPTNITVSGSVDGALVADTDYFVIKNEDGTWGLYIKDTATVTTTAQVLTLEFDYTPAASITFDMGEPSGSLVSKVVEFSKTIDGKLFRVRLWAATNEGGFSLAFPDSAADDAVSMPITLTGGLDTSRATNKKLVEIYDEVGLTL